MIRAVWVSADEYDTRVANAVARDHKAREKAAGVAARVKSQADGNIAAAANAKNKGIIKMTWLFCCPVASTRTASRRMLILRWLW